MKFKLLFLFIGSFFANSNIICQLPGGNLFDRTTVHEVHITFDEENFWDILMENYNSGQTGKSLPSKRPHSKSISNQEKLRLIESMAAESDDIPYLDGEVEIDGKIINPTGVRLKGYSSFFSETGTKKSLKLDFNVFNDTLNYFGLKKINLNNGVGDPSFQRDVICYELLRKAGIAVPRTSFARVYLNDIYWGLYVVVEQVDKTFLKNNFPDGNGNLYKAVGWSTLEYFSDNFQDYAESIELKTNEETADGSDYIQLVRNINNLQNPTFIDSIQQIFYVDYFLKILVIDIITKNWDSFMQNGRNFYLYHEPVSDLFYWIPWDYNLALDGQLGWASSEVPGCEASISFDYDTSGLFMNYRITTPTKGFSYLWIEFGDGQNITYDAYSMDIPDTASNIYIEGLHQYAYKGIYPVYMSRGDSNNCWYESEARVYLMDTTNLCKSLLTMDRAFMEGDTTYALAYNEDAFCCECSWDALCESLREKKFMNSHIDDSRYPIDYREQRPLINKLMWDSYFRNRYMDIFKFILDSVYDENEIIQLVQDNTDLIREAVYADTNLIFSAPDFENDIQAMCNMKFAVTSITRQIEKRKPGLYEEYSSLNYTAKPVEEEIYYQDVVINEFSAAQDEEEEDGDWIELYNNTGRIIPLNHFWLSDSLPFPMKFNFPYNSAIKPHGFVTVWADKVDTKRWIHTGFKLSAEGEEITLYNDLWGMVDSIVYDEQSDDFTFGRDPDGTGEFITMLPSWNRSNSTVVFIDPSDEYFPEQNSISIFPNPAHTTLTVIQQNGSSISSISLINSHGETVFRDTSGSTTTEIDVSILPAGLYIIHLDDNQSIIQHKIIVY